MEQHLPRSLMPKAYLFLFNKITPPKLLLCPRLLSLAVVPDTIFPSQPTCERLQLPLVLSTIRFGWGEPGQGRTGLSLRKPLAGVVFDCPWPTSPLWLSGPVPAVGLGGGEHRAGVQQDGPCVKALPWDWSHPAAPREEQWLCWWFFIPTPWPSHRVRSWALSPRKPSPLHSPLSFPLNSRPWLFGIN